jgi:hypothetical protein
MTRQLTDGLHVRYDYHEHPRGISAVVLDGDDRIKAVGFAKYNPRDPGFNLALGERIALGRAMQKITEGPWTRKVSVLGAFYPYEQTDALGHGHMVTG